MKNLNLYNEEILSKAKELGFSAIGTTQLALPDNAYKDFYYNWLQNKFHAEMQYMQKNAAQRFAPDMLLEHAKTAIVVLVSYNQEKPKLNSRYKISRYAVGLDYHFVIKSKLQNLLTYIQTLAPEVQGRAFVDSAPVPERYLASKAGLGFIGKNGMLINTLLGSFTFIGQLYINADFDIDALIINSNNEYERINQAQGSQVGYLTDFEYCANCDLCIKACPNEAIRSAGIIDSARCISYKTIEFKGVLQNHERLSGYIFGCDICQQVCPYNKDILINGWSEFEPCKQLSSLSDENWHEITGNQFKRLFQSSPMLRTGLKRIRRNIESVDN